MASRERGWGNLLVGRGVAYARYKQAENYVAIAMNVAVVDPNGDLVAFGRMDGAQLGSIAVSEHKARTAVKFRRPTKAFEEAIQKNDYKYVLTIDDVVGSRGGIPLVEDGKLIGAIGCSGGAGSQDEVACTAGAATISK